MRAGGRTILSYSASEPVGAIWISGRK